MWCFSLSVNKLCKCHLPSLIQKHKSIESWWWRFSWFLDDMLWCPIPWITLEHPSSRDFLFSLSVWEHDSVRRLGVCDYRITANDWRVVSPPAALQPQPPAAHRSSLSPCSWFLSASPSPAPPDAVPPEMTPGDRGRRWTKRGRRRMSLPPVMRDNSVAGMAERYERWDTKNFKFQSKDIFLALPEVIGGVAVMPPRFLIQSGSVCLSHHVQSHWQDNKYIRRKAVCSSSIFIATVLKPGSLA